ncbi:hypothetical protein B0H17DRAFT_541970 [Mycena rosella]|uniref:Uncharacterized protein n=1 Tax=Mycena rosella TaxID=1033263 RepID=A0AAD7BTY9_MYCRO|nr:hypothetical protein B0H17DRAFT_541970 [Mycena rosella]
MCLPILCQEFDELYPEALISTELACGSLRLIQRIGDGELPIWVWPHFSPYTGFESLEWGRHIRSSPELGPELLQDLRQFVPPWDVFVDEGRQRLLPIEFYDVVQWLKASSDPQLDLIERWQGYLAQSMGRSGVTYSGSDQLEKRWRRNMEREARSHGPPQPSDEEVIYCWEGVLENINRELGFEAEEFWAPAPDHIIPGTRVPATTALNLLNNLSVPKAAPKPGPFATAESPLFGARVGATPAGSIWAEPRDLMFPGEASQLQDTLKLEDQQQHLKEEKTGTFVIYSPDHEMPDPDDASLNPEDLIGDHGIEGCSVSVHEPVAAIAWIENNWEHPLLNSFQDKSCGGPLALMLSPQKPALALFGPYNDPSIATSAQSLAKLSGFPVVIRPLDENPVGTLLSDDSDLGIVNLAEGGNQAVKVPHAGGHDTAPTDIEMPGNEGVAGTSDESGERGAHDDDSHGQSEDGGDPGPDNGDTNGEMDCDRYLNHGGGYRALGGTGGGDDDDDGGGLTTTDDRWESHLHSTCLKLRLNLHGSKPYPISIAYDFKFQIIRVTDSPIDREQLTRDLSQPEVIALVDFKIENRPRETQVDRSYACIGFVAHRKESIRRRELYVPDNRVTHTYYLQSTSRG